MKIAIYTNIIRVNVLARQVADTIDSMQIVVSKLSRSDKWEDFYVAADLQLIFWMGTGLDNDLLQQASKLLQRGHINHLILVDNAEQDKISYGFTADEINKVWQYFRYDGKDNMHNLLHWLGVKFGGLELAFDEPHNLAWHGVYHPAWSGAVEDIEGYLQNHHIAGRRTVGIIFYRAEWITGDFTYHNELIRAIENKGLNVIAVFSNSYRDEKISSPTLMEALDKYFCRDGLPIVDVIISTMKFSLKAGGTRIDYLYSLGLPILEAYTVLAEQAEWEQSSAGLNPMEVSMSVAMPEFDGVIHAVPIAAKQRDEFGEATYTALTERMELIAGKAKKWAELRHKANNEKKIALVFHNYPPKNSNIGSAAGLDSIESVIRLLTVMKEAGYTIDFIPANTKEFIEIITRQATNDRRFMSEEQARKAEGQLSAKDYELFFKELPAKVRRELEKDWGEAPGDVFNYDSKLLVPGTLNGNIFITVQPPRGFGEDPGKLLHSPDAAPTHHYIGYYHWLRDIWRADAVIHVGTHGSLEWLPGKSTALSNECYPDVSLGDLPDIYPYWITIVGEGLQAKRRGAACLISHLSPPMQLAGGFGELAELELAIDEYQHFRSNQPDNLEAAKEQVRTKAMACNLQEEIVEGDNFDDYANSLHNYVTDIKNLQIRTGLHILGQMPENDNLIEFIAALMRMEHGGKPSLLRIIVKEQGYDYEELLKHSERITADGISYGRKLDELEDDMRGIIKFLAMGDYATDRVDDAMKIPLIATASNEGKDLFAKALLEIVADIVPRLRQTVNELQAVIRALDGKYIEPSPAGAPTTNGVEVLPTGRNFYGLDPRCMPTPLAWEYGKQLGDNLIESYIRDEGRYPEAVGVIFWAGSNMRSHGQCIAELFYLMGVRPVWLSASQRVIGLEIIPLEELKRPRIDVTARISGLFRDAVPDAIRWIDEAVRMVRDLAESDEDNYVRKHILADAQWLEESGTDSESAWQRASARIFGDPAGVYGAGVAALLESTEWETLDDLAAVYIRFSGTAYGGNGLPTAYEPELFKRRMAGLDVTVKNEDNRETHMFNTDDYNAYHGGMIATVRALTGKAPRSYSGDSSDRQRITMRTVEEEAARLFRGEAMNPKFIEGMKKHGYKGAADLANYLVHSYQWDATSGIIKDWMYEGYARRYVLDTAMQEWLQEVNPWALHRMAETLLEANQRGLWEADEAILSELRAVYLSIEGELEERADQADE